MSLVFEREPSFFDSLDVHGEATVLAADGAGEILGFALRSTDALWVEGRRQRVGYLGGLRVRGDARDLRSLKLGWDVIAQLHRDDPVDFYYTTIQETNHLARKVLEGGRFKIPAYHQIDTIVSHIFSPRAPRDPQCCDIVNGADVETGEIARVIEELGPARNLFPALTADELFTPRTRGLSRSDIFLAVDGSRVLGMLGRWDQSGFKQVRLSGYPASMRWLRPLLNAASPLTRGPHVPAAGERMKIVYLCLPLVRDDRLDVFSALVAGVARTLGPQTHCTLGLCESDPLLGGMRFRAYRERFGLYLVSPDEKAPRFTLPPYVEAATL